MTAPWWHPESSPAADVREFMREAGRGPGTAHLPMTWVSAVTLRHAAAWARKRGLPRSRWRYLAEDQHAEQLADCILVVVNGWVPLSVPGIAHLRDCRRVTVMWEHV